jgi:16S rRNA G966 N2-methylase RsmD
MLNVLPSGGVLYDMFCGGCAVTDCAVSLGKFDSYVINDINPLMPGLFMDTVNGRCRSPYFWCGHEEFDEKKHSDPLVKLLFSFGHDGRSYAYSREREEDAALVHEAICAAKASDRRRAILKLHSRGAFPKRSTQHLESADRIDALMEKYAGIQPLVRAYSGSYKDVPVTAEKGVIYCDPPYRKTVGYDNRKFNYEEFYAWASRQRLPVYISEYSMPEDLFECVWERPLNSIKGTSTGGQKKIMEKLFVPRRS